MSWMTTSTHDMSTDTFSDDVATRTSPRVLSRPDPEHEPEQELPTTPKPVANVFYPKKIAATTKNLLLDDAFNAESFEHKLMEVHEHLQRFLGRERKSVGPRSCCT